MNNISRGDNIQVKSIINNQKFLSIINQPENGNICLDEYDKVPHRTDNNDIVALGGWEFNITKIIYPTATIQEIFDGWNELIEEKIPMDLLFLSLFIRAVFDNDKSEIINEQEPELVALLRLCYWYHKCLQFTGKNNKENNYFIDKQNELKDELGRGVRAKARQYGVPAIADFGADIELYHREILPVLNAIKQRKAPKGFVEALREIRHSIYRFVSEFMFFSLASESGFDIVFIKTNLEEKNPDLFINTIPADIKTLIDEIQYQDQIEDSLFEEILFSLQRNKLISKINEGLKQGIIIVLDATGTSLGYAINLYASQNKKNLSVQKAITDAIELVINSEYNPIIILAQSCDLGCAFRLSVITVPIPVIVKGDELEVDISKLRIW